MFTVLPIFFQGFTVSGQEMSGITLSNYSGINSVRLNPSDLVNSQLYYDVNVLAGDIFLENNFLFIHKEDYGLLKFLKKNPEIPSTGVPGQGLDYNQSSKLIQGFEQTNFLGPSFSIALGDQAFGLSTRVVSMTSIKDLPEYLGELMYEGLNYDTLYGIPQNHNRFDAASAGWWEIGFSYARNFRKSHFEKWSFGANVRRLWGYAGAYLVNYNADYTLLNDTVIDIGYLDAGIGFSIPLDYDTNDFPDDGKTFKGRGTVLDIGVTYTKKQSVSAIRSYKSYCQYEYDDYLYKIGVSLLDIGSLRFTENAQEHRFENASLLWESIDTLEYRNINDLSGQLSKVFYGDPDASLIADSFVLGMPAALSIQADYNYYPKWHIASLVVVPLKLRNEQLHRPSQALLSLRYETDKFEIALPVSLYDFQKPRIGLSARLYYFTIGTDKLGGFFGFDDFYGMDLYFSAKFHILKGWCGRYKPAPNCKNYDF
ncbi:MAG: DUF5723 family protein [Bacteroidales bacterium]|nr:DUF5723 family protein [Bacteroidales bacterium]